MCVCTVHLYSGSLVSITWCWDSEPRSSVRAAGLLTPEHLTSPGADGVLKGKCTLLSCAGHRFVVTSDILCCGCRAWQPCAPSQAVRQGAKVEKQKKQFELITSKPRLPAPQLTVAHKILENHLWVAVLAISVCRCGHCS